MNLNVSKLKQHFFALSDPLEIAELLEVKHEALEYYRYGGESRYSIFYILKKSGGIREILRPNPGLKKLQQKLNTILQAVYRPKYSAHGFVTEKSIVSNAQAHILHYPRTILNLDLLDFFPSINFGRIRGLFISRPYNLPPSVATVLAQICCHDNKLPQGAPTSPVLSNMICAKMDDELNALAYEFRCVYTRYADDITFSTTDNRGFPKEMVEINSSNEITIGFEVQKIIETNGFFINEEKSRVQNPKDRQEVTGIIINSNKPNVPRRFVRQIRAMLYAWKQFGLLNAEQEFLAKYDTKRRNPWERSPSFENVVRGKIEFVGMVRGHDDTLYIKLLEQFKELANQNSHMVKQTSSAASFENISPPSKTDPVSVKETSRVTAGSPDSGTGSFDEAIPAEIELFFTEVQNEYSVHVMKPAEAECTERISLPFKAEELTAILKLLPCEAIEDAGLYPDQIEILTKLGYISDGVPIDQLQVEIGKKLFAALLPSSIGNFLKNLLTQLRHIQQPVTLSLKFAAEHATLTRYPWELIADQQSLLLSGAVHLTRYIHYASSSFDSLQVESLNLLYIESRPTDSELDRLPSGDENEECNAVRAALSSLEVEHFLSFESLQPASFSQLEKFLDGNSINVLHFDGHGKVARKCQKCHTLNYPHYLVCQRAGCGYNIAGTPPLGYLAFQNEVDNEIVDWVDSRYLGLLLAKYSVKLIVLSACRSGETRDRSVFGGVGPSLIQTGIPAVVAMQLPITVDSVQRFMKEFYSSIADLQSIPEAIRRGRRKLLRNPEWFIPIVYWRSKNSSKPFLKHSKLGRK